MSGAPRVAVVGGGVVGATLALRVQEALPGAALSVLAAGLGADTTSAVAAGLFRPGLSFRGPTEELTQRWVDDSYRHWRRLLESPDAAAAGVAPLDALVLSREHAHVTRNRRLERLLPHRAASARELRRGGGGWRYGARFSTLLVSCERYLPWAYARLAGGGARVLRAEVRSLTALAAQYDLVFNCTGLGARQLCGDDALVPLRGQVLRVRPPAPDPAEPAEPAEPAVALYADYDTYIIPGLDGAWTLGGTRQYDSYNERPCAHDAAAILERCCALEPALARAEPLGARVGLRPHRSPARVEAERAAPGRLVHCYGHGGYGVTCAPGTANYAVEIGIDLLKSNFRPKL